MRLIPDCAVSAATPSTCNMHYTHALHIACVIEKTGLHVFAMLKVNDLSMTCMCTHERQQHSHGSHNWSVACDDMAGHHREDNGIDAVPSSSFLSQTCTWFGCLPRHPRLHRLLLCCWCRYVSRMLIHTFSSMKCRF